MARTALSELRNLVVVSDLHAGCKLGLCPPGDIPLDDGGTYRQSRIQAKMWALWREVWEEWIPTVTKGEPYGVVCNGDALDGVHHRSTTQISQNLGDQAEIARRILRPVLDRCEGRYWHIRGTEAHVGPSAVEEERLARDLGAIKNEEGQHARWELWKRVGPALVHVMHHVSTTGSQHYESTAVHKEMVEAFTEAGRWGHEAPQVVVRSHRHRHIMVEMPTARGPAFSVVTPAWQAKTPFTYRIPGARQAQPQFGLILIRAVKADKRVTESGDDPLRILEWTRSLDRPEEE